MLKMQLSKPSKKRETRKLKRLAHNVDSTTVRPLATLWSQNASKFRGIPLDEQLEVVCSWAETIYGKGADTRLGLIEKTEELVARSAQIYKSYSVDRKKLPITMTDPLRVVMAELSY